jgi:hypothetical protein
VRSLESDSDTTSAARAKSNVRLRSNVFPTFGTYSPRVPEQIRGVSALKKYLSLQAPGVPLSIAARQHFTPWQQAELAYELGCSECHSIPEGRVRANGVPRIDFRCPRGTCGSTQPLALIIDLEVALLERLQSKHGLDIAPVVQKALYAHAMQAAQGLELDRPVVQRPIRLTRTQYYLFRSEPLPSFSRIVKSCLLALEESEDA